MYELRVASEGFHVSFLEDVTFHNGEIIIGP